MSDKKKYSKETEDRINRDLSESVERKRSVRRNRTDKKKQSDAKSKKEKSDSKNKDTDYVTVELPRKIRSTILKAAGLSGDSSGLKISAKISYKVKK